jgi:hypothetical protein
VELPRTAAERPAVFILEEIIFYEQKSSRQFFLGRKNISPVKVLCSGACGSDSAVFFENYGV